MTDNDEISRDGRIDRRKFLGGVGAGITVGVAGCGGGQPETEPGTETETDAQDTAEETTTQPSSGIKEGGKYLLGMSSPPNNLNILATGTAYAFTILDPIYTYGTTLHPETQEVIPYGFQEWTLNTDNIGTDKPTMTATLQDGLEFNDGEPVTSEDVKFTVEYIQEQEPAGSISASQFSAVSKVEAPDEKTVEYYLSEKDAGWATSILGQPFLPKHHWEDQDDYSKYNPRKTEEGVVGSGMMELGDFNWENWYELQVRDAEKMPWLDDWDFVHEDAPFIDALRIEVFGSSNAKNQALLNGDIDQTYGGLPTEKAAKATEKEFLKVIKSEDDGWHHHSFNLRRKPFDDREFRRFLVKAHDWKFIVEDLYKGIGAVKGDYVTPAAFDAWRPPAPEEAEEHEGIPLPDLLFPESTRGTSNLDDAARKEMRTFLTDNDDAKYDYTFEKYDSPVATAPDGKVLHVDGKPLPEAHTDNDGNPGQGPLEMSYNPPSDSPIGARIASNWIAVLKSAGIPVRNLVQSFNSQLPKVYTNHNFDMFEMGWTGIDVVNDHYDQLFGAAGVGEGGFNPMGYTGAQEFIDKNKKIMEMKPRQPIVKKILAQIWSDAPTCVTNYSVVLQPVTTKWSGHVKQVGGVTSTFNWTNVRQSK